jgi:hypothetical protein
MDATPDVPDILELGSGEDFRSWPQPDSFQSFDSSYSFSVVYRMNDFPFPSIHYPTSREDSSDSNFPSECLFGSTTLVSGVDPFMDQFSLKSHPETAVDCPKISPKGRLSMLLLPDSREQDGLMTPVKLIDLRSAVDDGASEARTVESSSNSDMSESLDGSVKETNPVEFRSGYRGVSWNRRMKAWLAFWSEGKNRRSKTFNAKVMGFDKARAAAIDFLKRKKQLLQQTDEHSTTDCCSSVFESLGECSDVLDGTTEFITD